MVEQEDGTMYLTQWHSCGTGGSTRMCGKSSIGEPNACLEEDEIDTAKLIVPTRNYHDCLKWQYDTQQQQGGL